MSNQTKIDIQLVVAMDLPEVHKYHAASGFNIDCPFCKRKNKLNININKNVWACPACGESGGYLALHSKLNGHGIDKKWASIDIRKRLGSMSAQNIEHFSSTFQTITEISNEESTSSNAYSLELRSKVFRKFLQHLPISKEFMNELSSDKRGNLPADFVAKLGYRSYSDRLLKSKFGDVNAAELSVIEANDMYAPVLADTPKIFANLFERDGSKVPGFTVDNGHIIAQKVENCDFLPVRSRHGEISYLQTKFPKLSENATAEEKEKYKKYGRYMSYGKLGCSTSGLESIHYTYQMGYNSETTPEEVWLTEGILKSDIASYLGNKPFIALVGISVYSQLSAELEYLKEHGTKRIVVATDMDYLDKPSVANAMNRICSIIKKSGLECHMATWNPEYKGIDDFMIAAKSGALNLDLKIEKKA
jgi:hypothetical protein